MKGAGVCAKFRQAWMEIVPTILFATKSRKTLTIVKFLRLPRFVNLKDDFGLLPLKLINVNFISDDFFI